MGNREAVCVICVRDVIFDRIVELFGPIGQIAIIFATAAHQQLNQSAFSIIPRIDSIYHIIVLFYAFNWASRKALMRKKWAHSIWMRMNAHPILIN